ncbi:MULTISPECIES: hypothetical protein [Actinomadura]|uniref:LapA family protein n=1 Tax=Actinomadura yumaensis TaxID=111807 RepID=A0ABW2CFM5_9ACTN|nr:hypothetical protein [Actinomadura sp. J1-007]
MVFIGLILVAASIAVGAGVALDNAGPAELVVFGQDVPGVHDVWQVFFAGAAVAVVFMVGMTATFMGFGRVMRTRRDLRYLREEHEESLTTLEMEKRRLQQELARVRRDAAARPAAPTPVPASPGAPGGAGATVTAPVPGPGGARRRPHIPASTSSFFDRAD